MVAAATGFGLGLMLEKCRQPDPVQVRPDALIGQRRPDFRLPDLDGRPHKISEWDGRALLLNFWASWCAPCRDEIPVLNALQKAFGHKGFSVIGIALDWPENIADFSDNIAIDYPQLIGEDTADDVLRRYGNLYGTLPYSVFIDKNGFIRRVHATGALKEAGARQALRELLKD